MNVGWMGPKLTENIDKMKQNGYHFDIKMFFKKEAKFEEFKKIFKFQEQIDFFSKIKATLVPCVLNDNSAER